jgi:single-strand DNA-binding protein
MSKSLNRVELLGHLGKDAETRYMNDGAAVSSMTVATTRSFKRGEEWHEETDWHRVTLWGREKLTQYLTKGTKVFVEGRLAHRKVEKDGETRYYTDVVASDVILCGGSSSGGSSSGGGRTSDAGRGDWDNAPTPGFPEPMGDDNIPF